MWHRPSFFSAFRGIRPCAPGLRRCGSRHLPTICEYCNVPRYATAPTDRIWLTSDSHVPYAAGRHAFGFFSSNPSD
ncbi:hypothetical protein BN931_1037 [Bifidobacterium animalis subsp. lactis CECT 8145]|nr:hypothetical protein W91_0571 [Bifidobacterium animalis subsp. lactis Bi-07]AJD33669.1 hypothetical protein BAA6_0556 [Bifidobacterium animalis]QIR80587.1 hypothetical protein M8PIadj_0569 [Bifidobacterium animalis]CDL71826.1 hypothetical protein BN931_1037 [Bifidobacterium animalis subsp. lactis CECT 8145]